jgi:hypothetical protein
VHDNAPLRWQISTIPAAAIITVFDDSFCFH